MERDRREMDLGAATLVARVDAEGWVALLPDRVASAPVQSAAMKLPTTEERHAIKLNVLNAAKL